MKKSKRLCLPEKCFTKKKKKRLSKPLASSAILNNGFRDYFVNLMTWRKDKINTVNEGTASTLGHVTVQMRFHSIEVYTNLFTPLPIIVSE